ncbi:hypothetical protein G6F57_015495 [Rhizopus arrhizus]|nr:hypothetical protein G6F57_015495 [Rhizopus arrhizus]
MSVASFIGVAGTLYLTGYGGLAYIMGWTGGYVLVAMLLAPYLRRFGQYTIPDFMGARYGGNMPRLAGVACAILCSFTYLVAQIYGVGIITTRMTGISFELGIFVALGGMLVPAVIYVLVNLGNPDTLRGWAIPAATDIAFALGILALLGSRVPTSLKIFLTALAILDDLGAIVIIALFYTSQLKVFALIMAGALLACLFCLNRAGVLRLTPYLLIGAVLWYFVLKSGVHATLAGVALSLTIPLRPRNAGQPQAHSPLHDLEHALHKPVALLIVPVFGFANAGVSFAGMGLDSLAQPVPLGVALGLFLGKQLGVFGFAWLAIKTGVASLPRHAARTQLDGGALLCGIGFTMSLFIGALAFSDAATVDATKIGVLTGSLASAVAGFLLLRLSGKPPETAKMSPR